MRDPTPALLYGFSHSQARHPCTWLHPCHDPQTFPLSNLSQRLGPLYRWKSKAREAKSDSFLQVCVLILPLQMSVMLPLKLHSLTLCPESRTRLQEDLAPTLCIRKEKCLPVYETSSHLLYPRFSCTQDPSHGRIYPLHPVSASVLWVPFIGKPTHEVTSGAPNLCPSFPPQPLSPSCSRNCLMTSPHRRAGLDALL